MRRNIKMLQKTGFSMLAIGFLKWKVFCNNETCKSRMLNFRAVSERFTFYFRCHLERWRSNVNHLKRKEWGSNMSSLKLLHIWSHKQREQLREGWYKLQPQDVNFLLCRRIMNSMILSISRKKAYAFASWKLTRF